jgi:hypothetical protein
LSGLRWAGAPLGVDATGLEGSMGDAPQEALVRRAVGAVPPEVAAMPRVEKIRVALAGAEDAAAARLRAELARAQLEASMLLERSGRVLTAGRF